MTPITDILELDFLNVSILLQLGLTLNRASPVSAGNPRTFEVFGHGFAALSRPLDSIRTVLARLIHASEVLFALLHTIVRF